MPIRVLAPDTACKIAAGEVVERPTSVVKELIENSIDAGATQVSVEVRGGGVNLIRVSDNGAGILSDEIEIAFQRHATSKITGLADLEQITSLGFRGEALASIAHVAQVELMTRSREEDNATYLRIQEGKVVEREPRAHPQGSSFVVRNLFRNVPARLKYIKSSTAESGHISSLISQYALAFPQIKFSLNIDGKVVLQTPGTGSMRDVLADVFGPQIAGAMLEVEGNQSLYEASGFISPISINRANRRYMSFYVNRRWIQSRMLARAVEKAYEGLLPQGRYPIAVIYVRLPTDTVDVNVHPAKQEVRFAQESIVFNTVYGAVRRTLVNKMPVPELGEPALSVEPPADILRLEAQPVQADFHMAQPQQRTEVPKVPRLRVLGQAGNLYIVAEGEDGLYLIDQHAAHERVMFERVLSQQARQKTEVQALLQPLALELSLAQEEILKARQDELRNFGFDLEPFGGRSWVIRAVPAALAGGDVASALKEIVDDLASGSDGHGMQEKVAMSIACHSAVRGGKALTPEEMAALVRELEVTSSPRTCPHGRPTMLHLSRGRLEKEFGRS